MNTNPDWRVSRALTSPAELQDALNDTPEGYHVNQILTDSGNRLKVQFFVIWRRNTLPFDDE